MIITRTPLRVSFFGGGTDYPAYYLRHGGAALAAAINRYVYVTVHHLTEYFDHRIQVHYSKVESVKTLDEIEIPIVREALRYLDILEGVEIHLVGDLPARTGLGTSSSTTVGLLKALHGHLGRLTTAEEVARQAIYIEQEMVGDPVGAQDQYIAAFGGLLRLSFRRDGSIVNEPLSLSRDRIGELSERLLLVYTGLQRGANEVLGEQVARTQTGDLDEPLARMKQHVDQAVEILSGNGSLSAFGELLHETWQLKRSLSSRVSTSWIDQLYEKVRRAGAVGGKLLGAGGGGFLLLYVEPEKSQKVRAALEEVREVPVRFVSQGASTVYFVPDEPERFVPPVSIPNE